MVHLTVPDRIRAKAKQIAEPLEKRYAGNTASICSGAGHYYGKIGELMLSERYGWRHADTYDYDLLTSDGKRVEVKVKRRTVKPKRHFYASVAAANTKQDCDYYLFCSTIEDQDLYVVGLLPKRDFLFFAERKSKGDPDPQSPPGQCWTFRADCLNITYDWLRPIGDLPLE